MPASTARATGSAASLIRPSVSDLSCHTLQLHCFHMANGRGRSASDAVADEWVTFPGGELEGRWPKVLCAAHRRQSRLGTGLADARTGALCFECHRAGLDRERSLKAAGELDTASDARFQSQLPFEPVNRARLQMLKAARASAAGASANGIGQYADKRRHAQIEARHALQAISAGLKARQLSPAVHARTMAFAAHAAELQLPEAWLPFVMSR
jgi:hypothetical protein